MIFGSVICHTAPQCGQRHISHLDFRLWTESYAGHLFHYADAHILRTFCWLCQCNYHRHIKILSFAYSLQITITFVFLWNVGNVWNMTLKGLSLNESWFVCVFCVSVSYQHGMSYICKMLILLKLDMFIIEIRLIWWHVDCWMQWCHICDNISAINEMKWIFHPSW